jgi:hypothetical protein
MVVEKQNAATEMAALILPAVGTNFQRHPKLQRFMLANDSTTIAVEMPIWPAEEDIAAIETQFGRLIIPQGAVRSERPQRPT